MVQEALRARHVELRIERGASSLVPRPIFLAFPAPISVRRSLDPLVDAIVATANSGDRAPVTFSTFMSLLILQTVDFLVNAPCRVRVELSFAHLVPKTAF